jgi:riboflavin-specific deaminase-like protein
MSARPFVIANFAVTADGKITTRNRTPSDFSSREDKRRLLEIRATGDAVLVGKGTVEADRMTMGMPDRSLRTERERRGQAPYPIRVILTNSGRIDPDLRVFKKGFSPIHVFSTTRMPAAVRRRLEKVCTVHRHEGDTVDLAAMLAELKAEHGVERVVCEGGATLFRSMLESDLVDELHVTLCPLVFGGSKAISLTGAAGDFLPASVRCRLAAMEVIGEECFLRYAVIRD